jgi:hypothetical protein
MNIFFLSFNVIECAKMYCDQHVIKILLEIVQMLYTAHDQDFIKEFAPFNKNKTRRGYKGAHKNHPMTMWVRESQLHYMFAAKLGLALAVEYYDRFQIKKDHHMRIPHACSEHIVWLYDNPPKSFSGEKSKTAVYSKQGIPLCMPVDHHDIDVITAYKSYYTTKTFGRWTTISSHEVTQLQ